MGNFLHPVNDYTVYVSSFSKSRAVGQFCWKSQRLKLTFVWHIIVVVSYIQGFYFMGNLILNSSHCHIFFLELLYTSIGLELIARFIKCPSGSAEGEASWHQLSLFR